MENREDKQVTAFLDLFKKAIDSDRLEIRCSVLLEDGETYVSVFIDGERCVSYMGNVSKITIV